MNLLFVSELYIKLHSGEIQNIPPASPIRHEIVSTIDTIYPNFKCNLYRMYPLLSAEEFFLCCLLKFSLRNVEIARLTLREPNSISMRLKRLATKMFGEGSIQRLNEFIRSS